MISIITGGKAEIAFSKQGVTYYRCEDTGTLFSKPLQQDHKVGGEAHEERNNDADNEVRLERLIQLTGIDFPTVLDYGCGAGEFVSYLSRNGVDAAGHDPFNPLFPKYKESGWENTFDAITLIEVAEHLTTPFLEFQEIFAMLKPGGVVYMESSFSNHLTTDSPYINPALGHSTIWSHEGLNYVMQKIGFTPIEPINQNCRVYVK